MEDGLHRARVVGDRMFRAHNERDFDLDWHKEKADQLSERWQNIHSQIDGRLVRIYLLKKDNISHLCKHHKSLIDLSIPGLRTWTASAIL